jgi:hypothetical protein
MDGVSGMVVPGTVASMANSLWMSRSNPYGIKTQHQKKKECLPGSMVPANLSIREALPASVKN